MGGSSSQPELPALPQQHIVNVSDGQAHPAPGIERQQIGTTKQAKAVRPGLSLLRGTLRLENSQLQVEVVANVAGAVELLMPCVETPGERPWPKISAAPTGAVVRRMSIAASGKSELSFDCAGISLASLRKVGNHHSTTWPAVLVLRPGETAGALAQQPPDGTTLAFCASGAKTRKCCEPTPRTLH
ncbi:unnamed protein product [Effrenium voratum]|uniref:Uncharacterized protein n=1 Tax=Effrenium voratum TaxID=2562239 RepID=A0AA36JHG3_9DINO|nr:unnamed protein product [Effrenium voratum]